MAARLYPSRRAASALECPACSRVSRRRRSAYVMWWNFAIANTSAPSVAQHGGQRQAAGAALRAALGKRESERKRPRLRRGGTGSAAGGGDPYRGRCAPRQKRRRGSRGKRGKPCAAAQGSPPPVPLRGRRGSGGQAAAKPQTRHSSKTLTVKAKNDILKSWRRRVGASQPDEWNRPARCVRAFSFAYVRAAARGSPPPVPLRGKRGSGGQAAAKPQRGA